MDNRIKIRAEGQVQPNLEMKRERKEVVNSYGKTFWSFETTFKICPANMLLHPLAWASFDLRQAKICCFLLMWGQGAQKLERGSCGWAPTLREQVTDSRKAEMCCTKRWSARKSHSLAGMYSLHLGHWLSDLWQHWDLVYWGVKFGALHKHFKEKLLKVLCKACEAGLPHLQVIQRWIFLQQII